MAHVLLHIAIPVVLALFMNGVIYGNRLNKQDNNQPRNPWLPPGYVIAMIWVVIFGILGYVHYCLTVPSSASSSGYSSSYSSRYGGDYGLSYNRGHGSSGYGLSGYGSSGYAQGYKSSITPLSSTPLSSTPSSKATPSDASVAGRFIVATVAFCLSYPLITGLKVSNVEKIMNVLTLCVAFLAIGLVYVEQKKLTYFLIPFVVWAVYVNVVTLAFSNTSADPVVVA